jgi:RimJ/RimL family protein N-acetyltransferase
MAMPQLPRLVVREMQLAEVEIRIDYFHDSSDEHLSQLGVDRASLPSKAVWSAAHAEEFALPIERRPVLSLIWEIDDRIVGFSSADRITYGEEAFMHLHIVNPDLRRRGLGTEFAKESVHHYFRLLELNRLYCEPNAFNTAPNRTLQSAGFHFLFTHESKPGAINTHQAVTRWVLEGSASD